jgi:HEAT repeat protein
MAVTMEQVRTALAPIEPDYHAALRLRKQALPHLAKLAKGRDNLLAAKAVSLASLIGGKQAVALLLQATQHADPVVRLQAAAGVREMPDDDVSKIMLATLRDSDQSVRNVSLGSLRLIYAPDTMPAAIRTRIKALAKSDPEKFVRAEAKALLRSAEPGRRRRRSAARR